MSFDPRERRAAAEELFERGYNCAQAVACAYRDTLGMTEPQCARLVSSFGGGMGRMREVCGAVSGALLVLGNLHGYDDPADPEAKAGHYAHVQEFARRFRENNGSIICRELLEGIPAGQDTAPHAEARTKTFYERRPCKCYVGDAAEILAELLNEME